MTTGRGYGKTHGDTFGKALLINPVEPRTRPQNLSRSAQKITLLKYPDIKDSVAAVNAALRSYIADGSWKRSLERNIALSGYSLPAPPTPGVSWITLHGFARSGDAAM